MSESSSISVELFGKTAYPPGGDMSLAQNIRSIEPHRGEMILLGFEW